jgi:hypothetical protein
MMTPKFSVANRLAILLAATATIGFGMMAAHAQQPKPQYDKDGRAYYGSNGPNYSYQQGPNTRIFVTRRSWLDAGTEVLPGDRKFNDYAFPPGPSFGVQNYNRSTERQPLNPNSDLGGGPQQFPLY